MPRDFSTPAAEQRHQEGSVAGGHASVASRREEKAVGMAFARGWRSGHAAGFDAGFAAALAQRARA
ncbi:MAG: hypothetical protein ACM3ZV_07550 [Bacillota bacterium]